MEKTNNKKRYGVLAVVLVALLAAGVGTWAWLQAQEKLDNVFTVGSIDAPENKPSPIDPEQPGPDTDKNDSHARLFETKWVANSKMIPGATVDKNPNVGIKAGSDDAYVFIYVKNAIVKPDTSLDKTPFFTIKENGNWKPVEGQFKTNKDGNTGTEYVSGLFMYSKHSAAENLPAKLAANKAQQDVYTDELFTAVTIPSAMNSTDVVEAPTMTVSAYIFGAGQNGAEQGENADAQNALAQAKEWAKTQA